ncbi:MobQ family relaxase [Chroococcidiopsis sp. SAG 2025]|uniref:MobQ family relaxase n=1 Tax=Chroococcidiopsis sp. SAG 2025 TaxID=171389 RepID=UPI002937236B|nr:MobQ family relaxase [Chroococcidiopsis sp. SAG 2025]
MYHCNVQIITRSSGRSAVAAAAYRAREKLHDDRTGQTHDYRKRDGLSHAEILTPDHAPAWMKDRQKLWSEVEQRETRINSQLAREFVVALPKELSRDDNIKLAHGFAEKEFVKRGMIADVCLHDLDSNNPHAHIMLTMRQVDANGFKDEKKSARAWNKKELLQEQRAAWSHHVNQALAEARIPQQVDHRSWEAKGIERVPKIHLGWYASNQEKRGIATELGEENRQIDTLNVLLEERRKLEQEQAALEAKIRRKQQWEEYRRVSQQAAAQQAPAQESQAEEEKQRLKQLLDQQRDRERGKPRADGQQPDQAQGATPDQQLAKLKESLAALDAEREKGRLAAKWEAQPPLSPAPHEYPNQERKPERIALARISASPVLKEGAACHKTDIQLPKTL